jgi:hypothetical protein
MSGTLGVVLLKRMWPLMRLPFTVTVDVAEQVPLDPVTVYVVVALAFMLVVAHVEQVTPVAGDHV